jgi:hypothetical protein
VGSGYSLKRRKKRKNDKNEGKIQGQEKSGKYEKNKSKEGNIKKGNEDSVHSKIARSEVHPTSYPMGTGSTFPGVKRPGSEADHSPPTSTKVKKIWIYTSTPHAPSLCSA